MKEREKKKKRKSVAAETEDVEMADAEEGDKKAKPKKRKKDAGSDAEDEKVRENVNHFLLLIDLDGLQCLPIARENSQDGDQAQIEHTQRPECCGKA